ncbi:MAG: hypothetical protein AAFQ80_00525 [Cyanobacteria bacterium J06621_8]
MPLWYAGSFLSLLKSAAVATTEGTSATRCLGNPPNMRSGPVKRDNISFRTQLSHY